MRTITREQFGRGDFALTDTKVPLPYELTGLSPDGGHYILHIPDRWKKHAGKTDIEAAKADIPGAQDVCSLRVETVIFLRN
jgi:hypothetical protein